MLAHKETSLMELSYSGGVDFSNGDIFDGLGTELMFSCSQPKSHHEFDGTGAELYFSCSGPIDLEAIHL